MADARPPALLVSFVYLDFFEGNKGAFPYRDWALDSGAWSAFNAGVEVDLGEYVDKVLELRGSDPTMTDVFALDDITDWRVSLRNADRMRRLGVPDVIPTYHYGEPERVLEEIAEKYDKIALGGVAGKGVRWKRRLRWFNECFARVWPKRIHGFGFFDRRIMMELPFESVDATTWQINPCGFGNWAAYGGGRVSVRGSQQDLRVEIEHFLRLEAEVARRWRREMAEIGGEFSMRFVLCGGGPGHDSMVRLYRGEDALPRRVPGGR